MRAAPFFDIAVDLEDAGLIWQPEIGDEISRRSKPEAVSILVDPEGMTPVELRTAYLWLPSVEQLVFQFEVRQAVLFHAGLELSEDFMAYKAVIQTQSGMIESFGRNLRTALGLSLVGLLNDASEAVH